MQNVLVVSISMILVLKLMPHKKSKKISTTMRYLMLNVCIYYDPGKYKTNGYSNWFVE